MSVIHFSKESGRTRRLEGDEEQRLLGHASTPLLAALIRAALEIAARVGELLKLRWRDVNLDEGMVVLPPDITKTHEPRDIPITQNLRSVLAMRRHAPDGSEHGADAFVFGNAFGESVKYWRIREVWKTTCEAAKIDALNFHDLRRTAASTLRASGAPDHVVRDWLGHAGISTTSRYLKASRTELQKYVKRFEQRGAAKPTKRGDSHTGRLARLDGER